ERVKSLKAPAMSFSRRATGPAFTSFTSRNVSETFTRSFGSPLTSHTRYCAKRAAFVGIGMAYFSFLYSFVISSSSRTCVHLLHAVQSVDLRVSYMCEVT